MSCSRTTRVFNPVMTTLRQNSGFAPLLPRSSDLSVNYSLERGEGQFGVYPERCRYRVETPGQYSFGHVLPRPSFYMTFSNAVDTFMTVLGPTEESLRQGLATVYPQAVAYGGVASGLAEDSCKWVLFSEEGIERESSETKSFTVMALPGQLAFMLSAVVKNWAQPKLQQPLAYLTPKYGDDSVLDLLTAIRFNDWDKFIYLIEEDNVDVNVRWTHKQNQTPILAAAGRGRVEMVEYLLKKGADVNIRNASGFTAIMYTDLLQNEEASALPNDRLSRQRDILLDAGATPEPFVQVPAQ